MAPDQLIPSGDPAIAGYIGLMVIGFMIGVFGHIIRSNGTVAFGIGMIFFAIVLLPLAVEVLNGG